MGGVAVEPGIPAGMRFWIADGMVGGLPIEGAEADMAGGTITYCDQRSFQSDKAKEYVLIGIPEARSPAFFSVGMPCAKRLPS